MPVDTPPLLAERSQRDEVVTFRPDVSNNDSTDCDNVATQVQDLRKILSQSLPDPQWEYELLSLSVAKVNEKMETMFTNVADLGGKLANVYAKLETFLAANSSGIGASGSGIRLGAGYSEGNYDLSPVSSLPSQLIGRRADTACRT